MKRPSFESLAVGYLVAVAIGIGLSTTGCEKNITEVIVDEAAKVDTVTIEIPVPGDTLWLPCPPGQWNEETETCDHDHDEDDD